MVAEFRLFGEVGFAAGGRRVDVGPPRRRYVLAALLVDVNRVVPVDRLVDRVWAEHAPGKANDVLYSYVSRLRQVLAAAPDVGLVRRSGGYVLEADPLTVDLHRFRDLVTQARSAGDEALHLLDEALALWHDTPLTGLDTPWARSVRNSLAVERLAVETERAEQRLAQGQHTAVLTDLPVLAAAHPLDERIAHQLMLALYRSGRQADALDHYEQVRRRLADELGADPGPLLQDLHQRILTADPALNLAGPGIRAETATGPTVVPQQLPAIPRLFTGRTDQLAALDAALDDQGTVMISAIGGVGGIGKTWLALTWAHRNIDRFPDGQLFVDLHGFSPTAAPTNPGDVLRRFVTALGTDPDRLPSDLEALAALYRDLIAGKRMLIVLDNAVTADQVTPLLPGSPTCTVLVTGRTTLPSLIDRHGARHLPLDVLSRDEARALLATRLGEQRIDAEPGTTKELIRLCGRHPLALAITARHAATRPQIPLAELAAELRELGPEALDHDTDPTASLPTVLSWSLHHLTEQQRTVFALLGIAPGPDSTLPAAAALTGLPETATRKALVALEEASLVERRPHGRYVMHDLVRAYAATTATALPDDVRKAALTRVVDFHLHTAHAADRLLDPHRPLLRPDPPAPDVHPLPLPDTAAATAWLEAEHTTLLATQRTAATLGRHHAVWHLASNLETFHVLRGHRHGALAVWRAALDAAAHLPDPATRSRAHRLLGFACTRAGLHEEATGHLEQALDLAARHHDPAEQAHTHMALAIARARRGDDRRALDHTRQALGLYRTLDQPAWEATALNMVGWYAARLGEFDTARDHCHAALTLNRHHHHPHGEANTLDSLGYIAHHTGDHHQALDHYHHALALYRALGNTYQVADTLDSVGHPHTALGHHDQARAVWREALELYRQLGRDTDADRVQHQLDDLDNTTNRGPDAAANHPRAGIPAGNNHR